MGYPHITINRRHTRSQQLLAMVLHHITPYLDPNPASKAFCGVARELEELFHASGVQVITEADRAAAGLPPRDHNGMTLEEIGIIEERMLAAMLDGPGPVMVINSGQHSTATGAHPQKEKLSGDEIDKRNRAMERDLHLRNLKDQGL